MFHGPQSELEIARVFPALSEQAHELQRICVRFHVLRLGLFGSVATAHDFDEVSDLDFVVEFQQIPIADYADAYFGLHESLEELFGRPVDLVVESAIKNPYFREAVEESRTSIYAASGCQVPPRDL